jgi:uncharacterized protein YjiS (DUF1127 family)
MASSATVVRPATSAPQGLKRRVWQLAASLERALNRRRDRELLARLDDHLLKDMGLSRDEVRIECAKRAWQD